MYETFYHFREKPFSLTPDPSFFYLGKNHQLGVDILEYTLSVRAGFVLVTGEVGCGKTTLIQYIMGFLDSSVNIAVISNTHQGMGSVVRRTLAAFGLDYSSDDPVGNHEALNDFFRTEVSRGRCVLLVIEEAQNLDIDALEELRLISNFNLGKVPSLQIILCGQPEILAKLAVPELRQFSQRISATVYLRRLALTETRDYIMHRLRVAGGRVDIFSNEACATVYACSGGVPRLINQICDIACVFGYGRGSKIINAEIVLDASEEMRVGEFANLPDQENSQTHVRKRLLEEVAPYVRQLERIIPESQKCCSGVSLNRDKNTADQSDLKRGSVKANREAHNPPIRPIYEGEQGSETNEGQFRSTVRRKIGLVTAMVLLSLIGIGVPVLPSIECFQSSHWTCWDLKNISENWSSNQPITKHRTTFIPGRKPIEMVSITALPGSSSSPSGDNRLTTLGPKSPSSTAIETYKKEQGAHVVKSIQVEAGSGEQTVEYAASAADNSKADLPQIENFELTSTSDTVSHESLTSPNENMSSQFSGVTITDEDELATASNNDELPQRELIVLLQYALKQQHYEPGPIDGKLGYLTTAAIKSFQRDLGLAPDGQPTAKLLKRLRDQSEKPARSDGVQPTDGIDFPADTEASPAVSSIAGGLGGSPHSVRLASTADVSVPNRNYADPSAQPPTGPPISLVPMNIWANGGDLSSDLGDNQHRDSELILLIQDALQKLGYQPGPVNGELGTRTANSIKAFQHDYALAADGEPSSELLQRLRSNLGIHSSQGSDPHPSNLSNQAR